MLAAYQIEKKQERGKEVSSCRKTIAEALAEEAEEQNVSELTVRPPYAYYCYAGTIVALH